jgi:hypothetical protein
MIVNCLRGLLANGQLIDCLCHSFIQFTVIFICSTACSNPADEEKFTDIVNLSGQEFAGSATCQSCHSKIYRSHILTPHFLTSQWASTQSIKGSLDSGKNEFVYNSHLKVIVEKKGQEIFQVAFSHGEEAIKKRMDIVVGSGQKGQSYLFWNDSSLYQLPVSYFSPLSQWSNSPGYPSDKVLFNRNVTGRCMECHSTTTKISLKDGLEIFDPSQLILGIDCERCHGPAARHVSFHRKNPNEKSGHEIISISGLNRQQKIDACALCHSGVRQSIKPVFSFATGDKLDEFSQPDYQNDSSRYLDVHGNQYGLLTASKCFKLTSMDCSTCHNVHNKESNNLVLFSQRCMNCHQENKNFCTVKNAVDIKKNCIDCHMPLMPSGKIQLMVSQRHSVIPDLVRTHLIKVYPTANIETDKIREYIKKMKAQKI